MTAYRQQQPERFWVHAIAHGKASARSSRLLLQLPEGIEIARATIWTDAGENEAEMAKEDGRLRVSLPMGIPYVIIKLCTQ